MRVTLYTVLSIITLYTRGARAGLAGFGGDYGEYLQLLKGNEVMDTFGGGGLDDVEEGQARQEAVMGGQDEELKDGFLRQLTFDKKKNKKDIHLHFDVNVVVLNKNLTPSFDKMEPIVEKELKLMERNTNGESKESVPTNEPFDWKAIQVTIIHCFNFCFHQYLSRQGENLGRTKLREKVEEEPLVDGEDKQEVDSQVELVLQEKDSPVEVLELGKQQDNLITGVREVYLKTEK